MRVPIVTIVSPLSLAALVLIHLKQKIFFVSELLHAIQVSFFRSARYESIACEEPVGSVARFDEERGCADLENVVGATEVDAGRIISSLLDLLGLRINLCLLFALDLRTNHFRLGSAKPVVLRRVRLRLSLLQFRLRHGCLAVREAYGGTLSILLDPVIELGDPDVFDVDTHTELGRSLKVV